MAVDGLGGEELGAGVWEAILIKPYYQDDLCTLYCADARRLLPKLNQKFDAWITDPIWPNNKVYVQDPYRLFAETVQYAVGSTNRLVIHLGGDSDPRIMNSIPEGYPFFRVCHLRYACPSYKGRVLYTADIAYVFGRPPKAKVGAMVLPGEIMSTKSDGLFRAGNGRNKSFTRGSGDGLLHPSPRRYQHVEWLVKWFGGETVLDPFVGSGTTLLAAKRQGVASVGIEINEQFCALAVKRLRGQL